MLLGTAATALSIILMDQFQDAVYQREKWLVFGILAAWYWTRMYTYQGKPAISRTGFLRNSPVTVNNMHTSATSHPQTSIGE
jgi:hypothetical protein